MAQILIVDDGPDMLALLATIIREKTNHKVTTANNSLEVPNLVKEGGYDLVATNLRMPGIDGMELIDEIRKIDKHIPILMITGHGSTETAEEAISKGAYDYITKPFRKEQVLIAISRALEWQGMKREIRYLRQHFTKGMERRRYWRDKDGTPVGIERRRYRRVLCEIPIGYSLIERGSPVSGKSKTVNIGLGGVMFPVDQVIAKETLFHLVLALPDAPAIKATGRVIWIKRIEDRSYHLGVQLWRIQDEDRIRIADYIFK